MYNFKLPDQQMLRKIYEQYSFARVLITRDIEIAIEEVLRGLLSHPTVKGRVKEFESYYKKYVKILKSLSLSDRSKSPIITDLIGIRIICPFLEDLSIIANLLQNTFEIIEVEQKGSDYYSFKEFGYESIHLLIKIPETIIKKRGDCGLEVVEIQIRTILQDAWAEVEHELVYKAEFTPYDRLMKRKLAAVNASLSLADTIFQDFRTYQRQLSEALGKRRTSFFKRIEESTDTILFNQEHIRSSSGREPLEVDAVETDNVLGDEPSDINDLELDNSIDELLLKALHAHNKNQFQEAITFYTRILGMTTNNNVISIIYKHRGMANFAQFQYDEAIIDFTKSLEMDGKSYNAAYYRGLVKAVLQQFFDAIDDFTLSLKINPYQPFCLYRRGQAYYHIEDFSQSLADCEAALLLEPNSQLIRKFKDMVIAKLNM